MPFGNDIGIAPRVVTVASATGGTLTINMQATDVFEVTALAAAANIVLSNTAAAFPFQSILICFLDNGTGRALTWDAVFVPIEITLPTTTVASKYLYVGGFWNDTASALHVVGTRQQA